MEFRNNGQEKGAIITKVAPGSPAEKAGLKIKDQIIEFAGYKIKNPRDLPKAVRKVSVGKKVNIKIIRKGKPIRLSIRPQLLEKNSLAFFQNPSIPKKAKRKGLSVAGGFKVAEISSTFLKQFHQPDLGAENPLVVEVKQNSRLLKGA